MGQQTTQTMYDAGINEWYQFVYGYSDEVITATVDELDIRGDDLVLDPFNGTGTTTLAAKKLGIDAIGTDTSPVSILSASAKASAWDIDTEAFKTRKEDLYASIKPELRQISEHRPGTLASFATDGSGIAPSQEKGHAFEVPDTVSDAWLTDTAAKKMAAIKYHIDALPDDDLANIFRLAMVAILPETVADVRFSPEITSVDNDNEPDVWGAFRDKVEHMERSIHRAQSARKPDSAPLGSVEIFQADARSVGDVLSSNSSLLRKHGGTVDYVITSPPYPAEHDYTRNQRLELAWLDEADTIEDIRQIKKSNIRSHTKNVYADDSAGEQLTIRDNTRVDAIVSEMESIIQDENIEHGFGQMYPRVVEEYFAGMVQHLNSIYDILADGGVATYIIGDSGSYWQVEIETASILGELAIERSGFTQSNIVQWRDIAAPSGAYDSIDENMLMLTK